MKNLLKNLLCNRLPAPTPLEASQPTSRVGQIPWRILEIERAHRRTPFESVQRLREFDIETLEDLVDPAVMLRLVNAENLSAYARQNEISLDWLISGVLPVHQPTHLYWGATEIARQITEAYRYGELRGIQIVANRVKLCDAQTMMTITIRVADPLAPDAPQKTQSWPVACWDGGARASILAVIKWMLYAGDITGDSVFTPTGTVVRTPAYDDYMYGKIHLQTALAQNIGVWNPSEIVHHHAQDFANPNMIEMRDTSDMLVEMIEIFHGITNIPEPRL
jgi:hypothetical protein